MEDICGDNSDQTEEAWSTHRQPNGQQASSASLHVEKGATGETRMRFDSFVCPLQYINTFTPMEFEEVI